MGQLIIIEDLNPKRSLPGEPKTIYKILVAEKNGNPAVASEVSCCCKCCVPYEYTYCCLLVPWNGPQCSIFKFANSTCIETSNVELIEDLCDPDGPLEELEGYRCESLGPDLCKDNEIGGIVNQTCEKGRWYDDYLCENEINNPFADKCGDPGWPPRKNI